MIEVAQTNKLMIDCEKKLGVKRQNKVESLTNCNINLFTTYDTRVIRPATTYITN